MPEEYMLDVIKQNLGALSDEDKAKMKQFLTPGSVGMIAKLFGPDVGQALAPLANREVVLAPVPRKAMQFIGKEKFDSFIAKAMERASMGGGLVSRQNPNTEQVQNGGQPQQSPPQQAMPPVPQQQPIAQQQAAPTKAAMTSGLFKR